MNISIESIISVASICLTSIGSCLTFISTVIILLTLFEMKKQREATQKPELIIKNMSITGFSRSPNNYLATVWKNYDKNGDIAKIFELPTFSIHNVGFGAAKNVEMVWRYDVKKYIDLIIKFCSKYTPPISMTNENGYIQFNSQDMMNFALIEQEHKITKGFILPSVDKLDDEEFILSGIYLLIISMIIYLRVFHVKTIKPSLSVDRIETLLPLPKFVVELKYQDISDKEYIKKFNGSLDTHIRYDISESDMEEVFYAFFNFKLQK